MLSEESDRLLADMINTMAQLELAVESLREKLSLIGGFTPEVAFSLIAVEGSDSISSVDLVRFLDSSSVFAKESEAKMIVKQYDFDGDERISRKEFERLVLPADNQAITALVQKRQKGERSPSLQSSLCSLLACEMDYHRSLQPVIRRLRLQPDFRTSSAFASVTLPLSSYVTRTSLRFFLSNHGIAVTEGVLRAVLRRLDRDGDDRLVYAEFRRPFIEVLLCADSGKEPTTLKACKSLTRLQPIPGETIRYSAMRPHQALDPHFNSKSLRSPARVAISPATHSPPLSPSSKSTLLLSPRYTARKYSSYCLPLAVRDIVSAFFEERLAFLREADIRRRNLALDYGFTLERTFRTFDRDDKGNVTELDLVEGLYALGSIAASREVSLLFLSLRPSTPFQLNFAEFCDLLLPSAYRHYASQISREDDTGDIGVLTGNRVGELLQLRIETERRLEGYRIALNKMSYFHPHEVFSAINIGRDNNLKVSDLRIFLEASHVPATDSEIKSLLSSLSQESEPISSHSFAAALSPLTLTPI